MLRLTLAGVLALSACRISLEDGGVAIDAGSNLSPSCMEAQTNQDIGFIERRIFATSCVFSGCHNGANDDAGRMDLREGMAHASLVGKPSNIDPAYNLVAAGQANQSYLMYMIKHFTDEEMVPPVAMPPPLDVGFMPQNAGGATLCLPKRESIERWIMAGAPP